MPTVDRFMPGDARFAGRFARLVAGAFPLVLVASGALGAQVVRGVVVDSATGSPVPGVVVVLLDGAGKRVAAVIAGDDGRYAVRSTSPGQYALRAERIGFRAAAPRPVALSAGETVEVRLVTSPLPVRLSSVRVTARTACVARAEGDDVSAVWEEARKALLATDVTQRDELFTVKVSRFERTLEPRTSKVLSYESKQSTGATKSPFVAIPAARLSSEGFVRQNESETIYYGPDASVLLSDEFLNDHCFRLRQGTDARSSLIGLQFEPVRGRDKPDIAGTLWIDRQSSELRDLEYSYQRLPNLPTTAKSEDFGGRVEFHRMPTGAWIVERWVIRMPVVVDRGLYSQSTDAVIPGLGRPATERIRLAAIREEGGEVLESIARGARRELAVDNVTVRGVVFDSTRMIPLPSARVFLDGTQFSTQTAADGAFVLENVPPGTYALSVVHGRFDSLGVRPPSETMTLRAGEVPTMQLAAPSLATLMARDCKPEERGPGTAVLRGRVLEDASGTPGIDVEVVASWNQVGQQNARGAAPAQRTLRTRTDSTGRYGICGLPERVEVTVRAVADRRRSTPERLVLPEGQLSVFDLALSSSEAVVAAVDSFSNVAKEVQAASAAKAAQAAAGSHLSMAGVERRRRRGGMHLTRAQIEKANATRFTDLLRTLPGVAVRPDESGVPIVEVRSTKGIQRDDGLAAGHGTVPIVAGNSSPDRCPAEMRLDGMPLENNGGAIDANVHPRRLEVVEVYSGAQVPVEFAARGTNCGMVLIWTREFAERTAHP